MFLVQKWPFFQFFFILAIQTMKMSFTISQNEKMPFQGTKTRSCKSQKIYIFVKWLTQSFGPKIAIFPTFFFQAIQSRNMSFTIFQNEKMPFQSIKRRSSKSRKVDIFLKGLTNGVGPKMAFFPTFFLGNIDQVNVFYDILERKMPFQAIKRKVQKVEKGTFF